MTRSGHFLTVANRLKNLHINGRLDSARSISDDYEMAHTSLNLLKFVLASAAVVLACFTFAAEAFSFDVHELFENRCGGCHEHASDLTQEELVIIDGILRSQKSNRDIRTFLPTHYGNLQPSETLALYDLLSWQVQAGGKFKTRCAICHVKARTLAQMNLIRGDNVLRGRYSDRDMTEFLAYHGRIEEADISFFIQLFMRLSPMASNR